MPPVKWRHQTKRALPGWRIVLVNLPINSSLFARINAALPQTQCTRCAYPDCAAYARAISSGQAAINQCPPGGAEGVQRLAAITGPAGSSPNPAKAAKARVRWPSSTKPGALAARCGSMPARPTHPGSHKMMHTVIERYCTGCELCVPVCPVDCISLENVTGSQTGWRAWSQQQAETARQRYAFHSYKRPFTRARALKNLMK